MKFMTKNPFYNAVLGLLYIVAVVSLIFFGSKWAESQPDNMLMPIGMLSLFVLSASVMGYLFLAQPIILFLDNKRKEAVSLFLRTIAVFAGLTAIVLVASVTIFR